MPRSISISAERSTVNGAPVEGGFVRAEVSLTCISESGATLLRDGVIGLEEAIERFGERRVRQTIGL